MPPFDWSVYFAGWTVDDLLSASMLGAMAFAPLVVLRLVYRVAFEFVGGVVRRIVGR